MKKCPNDGALLDDQHQYCPYCGSKLIPFVPQNAAESQMGNQNTRQSEIPTAPGWLGAVLGILGLVIMYEWSLFLGIAVGIGGIIAGCLAPSNVGKWTAIIIGIINIGLFLYYI